MALSKIFRKFTEDDWHSYMGAEGDAHIAEFSNGPWQVDVVACDGGVGAYWMNETGDIKSYHVALEGLRDMRDRLANYAVSVMDATVLHPDHFAAELLARGFQDMD